MLIFEREIQIYQILVPAVSTGVLITGITLFSYLFRRTGEKIYFAMLLMNCFAFIFVLSEIIVLVAGGWFQNPVIGMHFHRAEQIAGVFFIFGLPYFIHHITELNEKWKKVNRIIWITALAFCFLVLVIAYAAPDLFISQDNHRSTWLSLAWDHARGKEGPLYFARDCFLGIMVIYSIVSMAAEIRIHKRYKYIVLPLIGLIIAVLGAAEDILYVHEKISIGPYPFPEAFYSRFSIGVTIFVLLSMAGVIRQYHDKSMQVETAFKDLENAYKILNHTEERFRQVAENIHEVFIIYDYRNRVFLYISPAYEEIYDRPLNVLYELPELFFDAIHQDDRDGYRTLLKRENLKERNEIEFRITRPDGSVRWVSNHISVIYDKNGEIYRLASVIEDITERKKSQEDLTYIAYHDPLTGLPNRRAFFERFQELISMAKREEPKKNKALLFLDLDRFKNLNDVFGHSFGDSLLKIASQRLGGCLRKSDYLYRLGSDEFTIILNGISDDLDAAIVAGKLIEVISGTMKVDGREVYLGLSIGIGIFPRDGDDMDLLVKNTDIALRDAKAEGSVYRFFNEDMTKQARERIVIENYLRTAINNDQFELYYQPFVDSEGVLTGMEALLRWKHPELGFVPPDKFIPIAETTGLIYDIGDWTLDRACRQAALWQSKGYPNLKIAVNLSAQQFSDKKLEYKVDLAVNKYDLNPGTLHLEITESSVMDNPDSAIRVMQSLNEKGISFSIDDFGIGYSSLSHIKRFKIDYLKIDKSFIKDLIVDQNNTEITRAIIAMAHNLNLRVIAEGVEAVTQFEFLNTLQCDLHQGFLFSRPVPAEEFEKLLEKRVLL
ncbi:MAG TPA: EAL domain-containing protein [Spirochaetota bacterium]|nr:EAL domain-containing protein [Spirochaetota bacterium]HSA15436.1 EAL domain-containing protein [Spirochaetota bacterium]